jgi:elongation factor Ts
LAKTITFGIEDYVSQGEINAAVVAELRRETGAGMMDCKKALAEAGGDKVKALEWLRKKGIAAAEKRSDRSTSEGIVACRVSADGKTAALVELNSETDFVAKNDMFRKLGDDLAVSVLEWIDSDGKTTADLMSRTLKSGDKAEFAMTDLIGKIGEKLAIGRFARLHSANGCIGTYVHSDNKLGVLVALDGITSDNPESQALGRDLAMQIAAANPSFVRRDEVPAEKIESERALETERARNEGKPEAAVARIAEGRINKWFSEVALLEQPYVKDPKLTIKDRIAETAKKTGNAIDIKAFARIRVGA